jgi:hypothetical protein
MAAAARVFSVRRADARQGGPGWRVARREGLDQAFKQLVADGRLGIARPRFLRTLYPASAAATYC